MIFVNSVPGNYILYKVYIKFMTNARLLKSLTIKEKRLEFFFILVISFRRNVTSQGPCTITSCIFFLCF